jgi:hypothetical protein
MGETEQMTHLELRNVELYETLQIISGQANHMIQHMGQMLVHDSRIATPEWERKFSDWNNAWMHCQEVLCPGILKRGADG